MTEKIKSGRRHPHHTAAKKAMQIVLLVDIKSQVQKSEDFPFNSKQDKIEGTPLTCPNS